MMSKNSTMGADFICLPCYTLYARKLMRFFEVFFEFDLKISEINISLIQSNKLSSSCLASCFPARNITQINFQNGPNFRRMCRKFSIGEMEPNCIIQIYRFLWNNLTKIIFILLLNQNAWTDGTSLYRPSSFRAPKVQKNLLFCHNLVVFQYFFIDLELCNIRTEFNMPTKFH